MAESAECSLGKLEHLKFIPSTYNKSVVTAVPIMSVMGRAEVGRLSGHAGRGYCNPTRY